MSCDYLVVTHALIPSTIFVPKLNVLDFHAT